MDRVSEVEAYVPVLLNFRDNSLVYTPEDLTLLRARVMNSENGVITAGESCEFGHELSEACLSESLETIKAPPGLSECLRRVEVYYYHHRIILKYVFDSLPPELERHAREFVLKHSRHILVTRFIAAINTASEEGGPVPGNNGLVTCYYSYCVLLVPLDPDFEDNIENLLGSHTFRIVEVTPRLLERDRVHIVRISIPSTHLYSTGTVKRFLRVDLINAIYQHMLYSKKESDSKELKLLEHFSEEALAQLNVMGEKQLHALWNHAVETLGGRMVDLQGVHQQALIFRVSTIALLLALVGIILTLALALFGG